MVVVEFHLVCKPTDDAEVIKILSENGLHRKKWIMKEKNVPIKIQHLKHKDENHDLVVVYVDQKYFDKEQGEDILNQLVSCLKKLSSELLLIEAKISEKGFGTTVHSLLEGAEENKWDSEVLKKEIEFATGGSETYCQYFSKELGEKYKLPIYSDSIRKENLKRGFLIYCHPKVSPQEVWNWWLEEDEKIKEAN